MLSIPWNPFRMDEEITQGRKNRFNNPETPNKSSSMDVGLKILIKQFSNGHAKSIVVVKPSLRLKKPTFPPNRIHRLASTNYESSFLKSCHLCNKNLSPDEDIYMYRGDQGFCSVKCRDRQIYVDEMKEAETSTKKIQLTTPRHCRPSEARALLEQFLHRHRPLSSRKNRALV